MLKTTTRKTSVVDPDDAFSMHNALVVFTYQLLWIINLHQDRADKGIRQASDIVQHYGRTNTSAKILDFTSIVIPSHVPTLHMLDRCGRGQLTQ